jgi:hypothetical protein
LGERKKQDLQDLMRSETRRGKRPIDIDERAVAAPNFNGSSNFSWITARGMSS